MQGAAVAGYRVAAGGEAVLEGLADLLAEQRQNVGRVGVRQVGRCDLEYQVADRVRDVDEFVDVSLRLRASAANPCTPFP